MTEAATKTPPTTSVEDALKAKTRDANRRPGESNAQAQETDGFQLVIEALKLNGIDTIFGLPGIPITDLTRKLQAAGIARDLLPP